MAKVIRFFTSALDVTRERPNPINPIPGESLLLWLIGKTQGTLAISAPEAEDWGWYCYADWKGGNYLLGACALEPTNDGKREWLLQIDKFRSTREKLLNQARMSQDDECADYFQHLIEREPEFQEVSIDPDR
ncbi:MAG: hypothetical protein QM757_38330 [Paludibaculum sp.]